MKVKNMSNHFIATEVPLKSSNLIEASAGTGKTYSIAILVLRLILEKELSIKEILMVTFTKAAVAELEERIRLFIRTAYKVSEDEEIDDSAIKKVVNSAIETLGKDKVKELLKEARLLLDETSVMTIHSFCQQSLNEFAFETNQLFDSETMQDTFSLVQEEVNKFWREQITILNPQLLKFLLNEELNRATISEIIADHLGGQRFIEYDQKSKYSFPIQEQEAALKDLLAVENEKDSFIKSLYQEVLDSSNELIDACNKNAHAKKAILPFINNPEVFLNTLSSKKGSAYVINLFSDWLEKIVLVEEYQSRIKAASRKVITLLYNIAIQKSLQNIVSYKEKHSMLSFDDMIVQLHKALTKDDNEKLVAEIRKKYQAVFIDEFQDTDKLQYEIFKNAFGEETTLFYIGDPKQSIYAWRQADLKTYFKASHEVQFKYGMNHNYRSTESFIKAMNVFFQPIKDFETFNFRGEEDGIKYIPVNSPIPNRNGVLLKRGEEEIPITVFEEANKDKISQAVCAQIIQLLENKEYLIEKNAKKRNIKPTDIGVLVRSKFEGQSIKKQLAKHGIPAITIDDSKVLESQEARYLFYLLSAFYESSIPTINKALLSPLTGFTRNEILKLNAEIELERFKEYGNIWSQNGIYAALMKFIADYDVKNNLLNKSQGNGERSITNLYQLIEILHKIQASKNFSPIELINWLKRSLEGMKVDGDEFEQRVESDMDAIEIVTIHKSKGLEYNIVFAPYLDLKAELRKPFCSFKDDVSGEYLFGFTDNLEADKAEIALRQIEQENRRLLYVAITRAVYKCFIFRNSYYADGSALSPFTGALMANSYPVDLIEFAISPDIEERYQYLKSKEQKICNPITTNNFILNERYWRKLSYSSLAKDPIYIQKSNSISDLKDYEYFIFKQLLKGNITGNLLHHIFENIDFANNQYWEKTIHSALTRFMPKQLENYKGFINQLVEEVLNAKVEIGNASFKLSDVPMEKRLNELEFDFNVPVFNTNSLNSLSSPDNHFAVNSYGELEGIINGKIDLFFEHNGLYYILDWKSNFLGDSIDHYTKENLHIAMTDNNYHLQYLIYTVAVKKYLERRLPNFNYEKDFGGVIYVFIRGVRKNNNQGIFVLKPEISKIEALENILSQSYG